MKVLSTILALGLMVMSANAVLIGDLRDLGLIDPNHPADPADSATYINILLDQGLNTTTTIGPNIYTRTSHDPLNGVYPDATLTGFDEQGILGTVDLGQGGFTYLLGKYDGPNYGSVVWYVGGLTGVISLPTSADGFGLSHTYLYNPGGGVINPTDGGGVPDNGSTLTLLGMAMAAVGMVKRKMATA